MAKLNKRARDIQKEFLPVGVKIARLQHELLQIGAYQAMRYLTKAADVFQEDVDRIVTLRDKPQKKGV